ncbi:metallophosphoesterase family protein, partial [Streptomyces sp. NPDC048179]|uniref:metallophosphoesterase family protein n=1 Tax=Streptomyces sp. NPDC048179 TaxID=3365506 RepID=UPI0037227847
MSRAEPEPETEVEPAPEPEPEVGRVAVLSDIHGVLPALEAVLAEPDVSRADRVVLTGDITAGPQPAEVIDVLRALGDRVLWLSGNADRELVEYRRGERADIPDPIGPFAAHALRADQVDFLAGLPKTVTLTVRGLGRVLFCHATPRDDEEIVLVDSSPERWAEVFAEVDPGIGTVVCGHTHLAFGQGAGLFSAGVNARFREPVRENRVAARAIRRRPGCGGRLRAGGGGESRVPGPVAGGRWPV